MAVISIPGVPVPQARMKFTSRGSFGRAYDPKAREKKIIRHYLEQYKTNECFNYPRVSFVFIMPIPSSTSKKIVEKYNKGMFKHDKKPDVDNLVKLYLDCLDGIIFEGDQSVSLGECIKVYGNEPKTLIYIHSTTQEVTQSEIAALSLTA